jgi:hypothetical protein
VQEIHGRSSESKRLEESNKFLRKFTPLCAQKGNDYFGKTI